MIKLRYIYISCKWFFLSVLLALFDFSTKFWIKNHLLIGDVFNIFPGMNCYYITNSGIAFGLFAPINICYQWIFVGISLLIIMMFFVVLYSAVLHNAIYESIAYSIIIGGAMGNTCDRILYGSVIDFIDCYFKDWHWPIFNIADMEICFGFILLIIRHIALRNKCIPN